MEKATADMSRRGLPVTIIRSPQSKQINLLTWRTSGRGRNQGAPSNVQSIKERFSIFKRQDSA